MKLKYPETYVKKNVDKVHISEKQIEEAVYFALGLGCLPNNNPVGEPEWDYADVEIDM